MLFKTPKFWYRPNDTRAPLIEHLLSPLSWLYAMGYNIDQSRKNRQHVDIPILCVGNIIAGGAGKTVTAQSFMSLVQKHKLAKKPHFLTRGYGSKIKGTMLVNLAQHSYEQCGDEPLLLAQDAPTIISKNRPEGADLAQRKGADLVIMDDGLQNPTLHKDISIVVIDGEMGFGNQKLLPAGPLRESLDEGFHKADAFVLIGQDKRDLIPTLPKKPIFSARFSALNEDAPSKDKPYVAFAGMGYPQKFFSYLKTLGYTLVEELDFPDHKPYTNNDIKALRAMAQSHKAELITTEKDIIRLPQGHGLNVHTLPVTLSWRDEGEVVAFLKTRINKARA